jgi:hypothetical protein
MSGHASELEQEVYERIVGRGEPLELVEAEVIEPATGLTEDQRAALWLYGRSLQSAAHQRYQARSILSLLERAEQGD